MPYNPSRHVRALAHLSIAALTLVAAPGMAPAGNTTTGAPAHRVEFSEIDDLKSVLATVRSKKVIEARVRTPGTVAALEVAEGDRVEAGAVLGKIVDPKIALKLKASDAQIVALESRLKTALSDRDRTAELLKRGVAPQARLDQAETAYVVAKNELAAARSERAVILEQAGEGDVLAPSMGRVLRVPVAEGSVVMSGESIATIAADEYLLRLEVPERHARHMKAGDWLRVGDRGTAGTSAGNTAAEGRITLVYPEIQAGRVIADAEVAGLGDYFVGERTLVWISAGKRQAIAIPASLTVKRFGMDYVRLKGADGAPVDVAVQLGLAVQGADGPARVEVLAGLRPGDEILEP